MATRQSRNPQTNDAEYFDACFESEEDYWLPEAEFEGQLTDVHISYDVKRTVLLSLHPKIKALLELGAYQAALSRGFTYAIIKASLYKNLKYNKTLSWQRDVSELEEINERNRRYYQYGVTCNETGAINKGSSAIIKIRFKEDLNNLGEYVDCFWAKVKKWHDEVPVLVPPRAGYYQTAANRDRYVYWDGGTFLGYYRKREFLLQGSEATSRAGVNRR